MNRFKWYRKWIGGTWYYISYSYKKDIGMTRVFETHWWYGDIEWYRQYDNFEILKIENYER